MRRKKPAQCAASRGSIRVTMAEEIVGGTEVVCAERVVPSLLQPASQTHRCFQVITERRLEIALHA